MRTRLASRAFLLPISLGATLTACAGNTEDDDGVTGGGGKADGYARILKCSEAASNTHPDIASVEGTFSVYELGTVTSWPDDLPSGISDWIAGAGFPVKKYRVITKLATNGDAPRSIDRYYWGNLFVGDGNDHGQAYSNDDAFELRVPDAGDADQEFRLTVAAMPGFHVSVPMTCEGTLPSAAEAIGDRYGLALDFDCTSPAAGALPRNDFKFTAIRIDRPETIDLLDRNDDGMPVQCPDDSDFIGLNENWTVAASTSKIVIEGDGDGIEYYKLDLSRPTAAGQTVTGTYVVTDSDDKVLTQRTVSCKATTAASLP
jgi:hypothetical protein